jgi:hypothetical protein
MRNLRQFVMLLSFVVFPVSLATAATSANCNSSFTACQIQENVLLTLPFDAFAGDVIIQSPSGTGVSDVFRIFNNIVDTGGGTGIGRLAILYSGDDNTPLPASSTYSQNVVTIKEAVSGPTSYFGNGTTYMFDTGAVASKLVYTGDTEASYDDPAQLSAVLTVLATGAPIANATVSFTIGSQTCSAVTNASGTASCPVTIKQAAGNSTVTAAFSGIFGSDAATSTSAPFVFGHENSTLSYTGDTIIANGGTAHLSGVLLEDNVTPIAGRTITFTLGKRGSLQTCTGITDTAGKAACTISPVKQPLGPGTVSAAFAGDEFYGASSANTNAIISNY